MRQTLAFEEVETRIFTPTSTRMIFAILSHDDSDCCPNITVCYCTAPQLDISVNFRTQGCETKKTLTFQDVEHSVIEHNPADFTFGGFRCQARDFGFHVEASGTPRSTHQSPVIRSH
ncbi:hypothetical protein BV898_17503 [Hypsibius exemplaris]|uniref:Uncharacterized protein n=1 Tax=Hypsibius exemplaris TaxID=2072580 RepID=A0A9X6NHC9_HYPEX|nr:hypothetical protein BV898_17503 [Hypsibius exemplaris]